jgi:prolipoprotein diacylglyceryltransferase
MPLAFLPSPARSAWHLGPLPLRAQALCVVAAILAGLAITAWRYRQAGGGDGVIADVAAWAVPAGLIPAALGILLAHGHPGVLQAVRSWDQLAGFPGAVAFGAAGAWVAARRIAPGRGPGPGSGRSRGRVALRHIAGAAAPALLFGHAIAMLGEWLAQRGYGKPAGLPWAVEISPALRAPGFENFATFHPVFAYQALWDVAAGVTVAWVARRLALSGTRVLALAAVAYGTSGLSLFWLGIAHSPAVFGLRATSLGDAALLVSAASYLARTHRGQGTTPQLSAKETLERSRQVM